MQRTRVAYDMQDETKTQLKLEVDKVEIPPILLQAAQDAMRSAYAPYSGYCVGVAIETKTGEIIQGCNIECADFLGIEALESAVSQLVTSQDWQSNSDALVVMRAVFSVSRMDYESLVHYPSPQSLGRLRFFAHEDTYLAFLDGRSDPESCLLSDLLPKSPNLHQAMAHFKNQKKADMLKPQIYAERLAGQDNVIPEDVFETLCKIRQNCLCPSSGYAVSALIETEAGQTHQGCNIETALHNAIHAEESAIAAMISAEGPEAKIKEILVMTSGERAGWPCGNCRQKISEFSTAETRVKSVSPEGSYSEKTMMDLLPEGFSKDDLPR